MRTIENMRSTTEPLMHLSENEKEITITADLPHAEKKSIKVKADRRRVEIFAECRHLGERFYAYAELPSSVNPKKSKARFRQGILEIRLPKEKGVEIRIE